MKILILTQQQQMRTIQKACRIPAMPTIHDKRINRMTPKMFWIVGRYTPTSVPILDA